jgi:cysteine-rich repeat protein
MRNGVQGACESTGYCAYPDDSCPSGLRYGDLAGPLANACTDEPTKGTTSTDVTSDEASEGSVGSDGSDGSDGSASEPVCGNGIVEGDEECDDGNDEDGDGCNTDCTRSGRIRWSSAHAGAGMASDVAHSVTTLASGGLAVTGFVTGEDGQRWIWVARYEAEGELVWSLQIGHEGRRDEGWGIVQGAEANLYVAGFETPPAESRRAWLGSITPDGAIEWERNPEGSMARAVSTFTTRVVVIGSVGSRSFAEAYNLSGNTLWRAEADSDRLDAVHVVNADEAYVTGRLDDDVWLARVVAPQFETVATHAGPVPGAQTGQDVLVDGALRIVAGYEISQLAGDAWVGAFAADGRLAWEYRPEPAPAPVNEEAEGLAIDPQGRLVVVGWETRENRDAWVAKIDPQTGHEIWHRSYHEEIPGAHTARSAAVAPDGTIYVVGEIEGDDGSSDAWIMALDP